jgi:ribose transport system permease protein
MSPGGVGMVAGGGGKESAPSLRSTATRHGVTVLRTYGIVISFAVLFIAVAIASDNFLTQTNLLSVTGQWAPQGLMAIGLTFVILTGGFDLSIAAVFTLAGCTAAAIGLNHPAPEAFAAGLAVGVVAGAVNGLIIAKANLNPFITTLGTSFILTGITYLATKQNYVVTNPEFGEIGSGKFLGIPYLAIILVAVLLLGGFVLRLTNYGQSIYAIGGNAEASRLSGIRVQPMIASTYVICGVCAAAGGVLSASEVSSATASTDPTLLFDVVTIVVVGGTSLTGGFGGMWRTAVGLGIVAVMSNGFDLIGVDPNYQYIVKGLIIVGALALDAYARRLSRAAG